MVSPNQYKQKHFFTVPTREAMGEDSSGNKNDAKQLIL